MHHNKIHYCVHIFVGRRRKRLSFFQKFKQISTDFIIYSLDGNRDVIIKMTLNYHIDLEVTLVKHALCTSSFGTLHLVSAHFKMSPILQGSHKTAIQGLTLNFDLDIELTLVKHTHCTSSSHT